MGPPSLQPRDGNPIGTRGARALVEAWKAATALQWLTFHLNGTLVSLGGLAPGTSPLFFLSLQTSSDILNMFFMTAGFFSPQE